MWLEKSSKLEFTAIRQDEFVRILELAHSLFNLPESPSRMKVSIKGHPFDATGELVFLDRKYHELDLSQTLPLQYTKYKQLIIYVKDVDGKTEKLHLENTEEGYDLEHVLIEVA